MEIKRKGREIPTTSSETGEKRFYVILVKRRKGGGRKDISKERKEGCKEEKKCVDKDQGRWRRKEAVDAIFDALKEVYSLLSR